MTKRTSAGGVEVVRSGEYNTIRDGEAKYSMTVLICISGADAGPKRNRLEESLHGWRGPRLTGLLLCTADLL